MKKLFNWAKNRLSHKLEHLNRKHLIELFKKHSLPFIVIVIGWEIIEDILFPLLFIFLGNTLHPIFYTIVPISWFLCLHWLAIPIIWSLWLKFSKEKNKSNDCEFH